MHSESTRFKADDGVEIFLRSWLPEGAAKGVVHIAHGMAEHGARYAPLAEALTADGYAVYANDHRGHGETARSDAELGFFAEERGFERLVRDIEGLILHERQLHPGLPVVLFGHSMGSYVVQWFLTEHADLVRGAILSATAGKPNLLASSGRLAARAERIRLGPRGHSKILDSLSFGAFNKQFAPNRTDFDWLSRDDAEVDKYVADPRCGFACTTSLWIDVLDALATIAEPDRQARIPKDLPIYVFAGSRDPVGGNTESVKLLLGAYRRAGLRDVTHRFYPDARHETLNETNRAEVVADVASWLRAKITPKSSP